MTVVNFPSRNMKQEAAWDDYLAALKRANETLDYQDGIAAGRAWSRFISQFCNGRLE